MRGEKIYEYDCDFTGATDYGVTLEAILSGKERVPRKAPASTSRLRGGPRAAYRVECVVSITSGCAPTVASTLISEQPSRPTTVNGSLYPPTA